MENQGVKNDARIFLQKNLSAQIHNNTKQYSLWVGTKRISFGFMLLWTLFIWIVLSGLYTLYITLSWFFHYPVFSFVDYPYAVFLVFPIVSLFLSSFVWYIKVTRLLKRELKGKDDVPSTFISKKDLLYSYWLSGNINLLLALLFVWVIEIVAHCFTLKSVFVDFGQYSGIDPSLSELPFPGLGPFIPELVLFIIGFTVFLGLIIWLVMFNPLGFLYLVVGALFFATGNNYFGYGVYVIYFLAIGVFLIYFFNALRNHTLSKKAGAVTLILCVFYFVSIIPNELTWRVNDAIVIITYLFFTSMIGITWVRVLHYLHNGKSIPEDMTKIGRKEAVYILFGYVIPILFCGLILFNRLDIHITTKYAQYCKLHSLPATLSEANKKYHTIPKDKNIADKYQELFPLYTEMDRKKKEFCDEINEKYLKNISNAQHQDCLQFNLKKKINYYSTLSFLGEEQTIPEVIFAIYKDYYKDLMKETNVKLHEIEQSGLTEGYHTNLRGYLGFALPGFSAIRGMVNGLCTEALISAVEKDYETMLKAFRSCIPVYNSLKEDPIIVSQSVRFSLFGNVFRHIQWILNHEEIPEEVLIELDDIVHKFDVPLQERPLIEKALHIEHLNMLETMPFYYKEEVLMYLYYIGINSHRDYMLWAWAPVLDIVYPKNIDGMISANYFDTLRKCSSKIIKGENINVPEMDILEDMYNRMFYKNNKDESIIGKLLYISSPRWLYFVTYSSKVNMTRLLSSEFEHYIFIDLLQTGFAIERFRIKNNRLPDSLQELVPDYIPSVPKDPWNQGNPIQYVREDDFAFKLYSFGDNQKDDGGEIDSSMGPLEDIGFYIKPLTIRQQPTVSSTVNLSSYCGD